VIRVVLAEDGVLLREGLAGLLQRFGFHVVAMAGDASELHAAAAEHEPGLVITDIRMPPSFTDEGLRAAVNLRRSRPGLAVVVLSQYVQHAYAADLLDSSDGRGGGYFRRRFTEDPPLMSFGRAMRGRRMIPIHAISTWLSPACYWRPGLRVAGRPAAMIGDGCLTRSTPPSADLAGQAGIAKTTHPAPGQACLHRSRPNLDVDVPLHDV